MTTISFLDLGRLNAPYFDSINNAVSHVVTSGRYIGGDEVTAFEQELAAYQHVNNVVAVSNGLDALRLILMAYIELGRLKPGDEVIVPANTYIASILSITHAGLKPVLVEPSIDTLNLDSQLIEQAITPLTRAIMPVHLYGRVCWDETIVDVARRHNLLVIEDNAQGIGARSTVAGLDGNFMAGSLGHASAFSFYPTKNLGAMGDAGAVATNDTQLAQTVRALANYGSLTRYNNIYAGYNCRMDPMQAALLRVKLPHLDADNHRRRQLADIYATACNPHLKVCTVTPDTATNYHQCIVITDHRDELRQHLAAQGIGTDIHYATPPHRQPCYRNTLGKLSFPITDHLAQRVVSLPVAPYLTDAEAHLITAALTNFNPL